MMFTNHSQTEQDEVTFGRYTEITESREDVIPLKQDEADIIIT